MNLFRFNSIRKQFVFGLLSIVSIILLVFLSGLTAYIRFEALRELETRIENIHKISDQSLIKALWQYNESYIESYIESVFLFEDVIFAGILANEIFIEKRVDSKFQDTPLLYFKMSNQFVYDETVLIHKKYEVGRLILVISKARINRNIFVSCTVAASLFIFIFMGILITTTRLSQRYLFNPLSHLEKVALEISKGRLDVEFSMDEKTELGRLASTFDHMIRQLRQTTASKDELEIEIQKRRKAQQASERFAAILENSLNEIYLFETKNYHLVHMNQAARENLGYSENELLTLKMTDIQLEIDRKAVPDAADTNMDDGKLVWTYSTVHRRKNSSVYPVDVSLQQMSFAQGDIFTAIVLDATEKRKIQAQLYQAQKMESIGTLAGGVAHEINNPINGIMNYAQLVKDQTPPTNPVSDYASEIIKETVRISRIVRNLLTFARKDDASFGPARMIDIIEAVMSLIQALIRKDHIIVHVNVPESLPKVNCRSHQIQQVIMNLATNARDELNKKYQGYDKKKRIEIISGLTQESGLSFLRTTVRDYGDGISEAVSKRIFDPFFSTKSKFEGTGLGLSISYGIVRDHNGMLTYESQVGEGTSFHMDLPIDFPNEDENHSRQGYWPWGVQ